MAHQDNTPAATPKSETNGVFWAKRYARSLRYAERLDALATRKTTAQRDVKALFCGASALWYVSGDDLKCAHMAGGLLFCWNGTQVDGGAA